MRVLVTGASGGIGNECVKQLAKRDDCEIIALSRSNDLLDILKNECLKKFNKEIDTIVADFQDVGFQNRITTYIKEKYGSLDCLINNAGMLINKPFLEMNGRDVEEQFRVNFSAPMILIQSLIPLLKKSESTAHVINIGSMGGFQGSDKFPGLSVYSASKAAISTLTECLAAEFVNDNIKFNCLALGSADTEMLRKAFPEYKSKMSPEVIAEFIVDFSLKGQQYFNGKVIPVAALST